MRRFIMLVVLLCSVTIVGPGSVTAQEASPVAAAVTCDVAPRSADELLSLWYAEDGTPFVGRTFEEAQRHATAAGKAIKAEARDPDVLDTWFSSAFVPFSTLGWPDEAQFERERQFYLPREGTTFAGMRFLED